MTTTPEILRALARRHDGITTVLWIDEDRGGRPVRVADLLRDEAARIEDEATEPGAAENWSRGDWMQTFTGRQFFPLTPAPEDIDPNDIAHALSLICRYGGHVTRFYSVAEHCVLLSHAVAPEHALWALLHDATEAYVGDMVRPIKRYLADYIAIEDRVAWAIAERFGLDPSMPAEVKDADNRILLDERAAVMAPAPHPWHQDGLEPLGVHVAGWPPEVAELRYRARLQELVDLDSWEWLGASR